MSKNNTDYQRQLNNAKIFANALFRGEVKLLREIHNSKNIAVYVPKERRVHDERRTDLRDTTNSK